MAPVPLPSQLFLSFYNSPVNKPHLLHPTTCTLARTYTHPCHQSRKLTFTPQQLTKGHEGPSFKSIYLIWVASVNMAAHSGCVGYTVYRGLVFFPSVVLSLLLEETLLQHINKYDSRGGLVCLLAQYFLCNFLLMFEMKAWSTINCKHLEDPNNFCL